MLIQFLHVNHWQLLGAKDILVISNNPDKEITGITFGDRGGHSRSCYNAITRLSKTYANLCLTVKNFCPNAPDQKVGIYHFQVDHANTHSAVV